MKKYKSPIIGHLEITVHQKEDEFEGVIEKWNDVLIHGDPQGLRSLANVLLEMANLDEEAVPDLPIGTGEHTHLKCQWDLSLSSDETIIGRLDAKGTGAFYKSYIPRELRPAKKPKPTKQP